jgi:replicative DNA helicase
VSSINAVIDYELYAQIIGCMLQDLGCAYEAAQMIRPEYFWSKEYRTVFERLRKILTNGGVINVYDPAILHEIPSDTDLPCQFNLEKLLNWRDMAHVSGFKIQLQRLRENAMRYILLGMTEKMRRSLLNPEKKFEQVLAEWQECHNAATQKMEFDESYIGPILEKTIEDINRRAADGREITGYSTGYKEIDRIIDGLVPGRLYIVGAYTSVGKTSFALNVLLNLLRQKLTGAYFSLEMGEMSLCRRLITMGGKISDCHLRKMGELEEDEYDRYTKIKSEIKSYDRKLCLFTRGAMNMERIILEARKLDVSQGLDAVVVDYIQQVQFSDSRRFSTDEQRIAEISRLLQALAREQNMVVIALSQVNIASMRADKGGGMRTTPTLLGLRGSGMLANDPDAVIILGRDKEKEKEVLLWSIAKNRHGDTGNGKLKFHLSSQRIEDARW